MDKIAEFLGFGKGKKVDMQSQAGAVTAEGAQANFEAWSKVAPDPKDKVIQAQNDAKATADIRTELNAQAPIPTSQDDLPLSLPQKGEAEYAPTSTSNTVSSPTDEIKPPTQIPTAAEASPTPEPANDEAVAA